MNPILSLMPIFLAAAAIGLFSFLSVTVWADQRRREREAFYRSEVLKEIALNPAQGGAVTLEIMRAEEQAAARKRSEGLKIGGLVNIAIGIAAGILFAVAPAAHKGLYFLIGIILFMIGAALLLYVYRLAPKDPK